MHVCLDITVEDGRVQGTATAGSAATPVEFAGWLQLIRLFEELMSDEELAGNRGRPVDCRDGQFAGPTDPVVRPPPAKS